MMVVTSNVLLNLTVLRPYQDLLQSKLVRRLKPESIATFVSHQWLAREHPDPHGAQLRCLQRFLEAAARNSVKEEMFSEDDWATFKRATSERPHMVHRHNADIMSSFSRHGPNSPDELLFADLARSFMWVDYLSVPQDTKAGDDSQQRAIHSISFYIEQSSFFLVLCPNVLHSDTGDTCEYQSWLKRGWCRFEMWVCVLSQQRATPLILTDRCAWPIGINEIFWGYGQSRAAVVGCGDFTCCRFNHQRADGTPIPCDQDSVMPILQSMWLSKVREAAQAHRQYMYTVLRLLETHLFARSTSDPFHATWKLRTIDDPSPERVLERIEADCLTQLLPIGCTASSIAADLGDERLLRLATERGWDPLLVDLDGDSCLKNACASGSTAAVEYLLALPNMTAEHINMCNHNNNTPLHSAVMRGAQIVGALLRGRAHPSPHSRSGKTPMHVAAMYGEAVSVRLLLAARAPADASDARGMTALHFAAEGFRVMGCWEGRLEAIQCLLEYGACPALLNQDQLSPCEVAARNRFHAAADLLQHVGAQRSRSWGRLWRARTH